MPKLTQKKLQEILDYYPNTGDFYWKINANNNRVPLGAKAGCLFDNGYIGIGVFGKNYLAHRLAVLWMEGYLPENEVDHIDRNPSNNRWANLREISSQCNKRNSKVPVNNKSGVKGVNFNKLTGKWEVGIFINNKKKYLGIYIDFDEAVCARLAGEQCLNWSGCDSNSSAYQYVQKMLKIR